MPPQLAEAPQIDDRTNEPPSAPGIGKSFRAFIGTILETAVLGMGALPSNGNYPKAPIERRQDETIH